MVVVTTMMMMMMCIPRGDARQRRMEKEIQSVSKLTRRETFQRGLGWRDR